jgi:carboxylate-amine ligase
MEKRYGITLKDRLTCGFQVQVSVVSDEETVAVLDHMRIRLPVLLALSGNAPCWQGTDSGYASSGTRRGGDGPRPAPGTFFGSVNAYRRLVKTLLQCDVMLDEGKVYFDARLAARTLVESATRD